MFYSLKNAVKENVAFYIIIISITHLLACIIDES